MITAPAEWLAYEAQQMGAQPSIRISILPYLWPTGVNVDGSFTHVFFVTPDRLESFDQVEGDGQPFSGGIWESEVVDSKMQVETSPAVITWDWNCPGFVQVVYWRGAGTEADVATESYVALTNGATIDLPPYYQFKMTLEGYRAWAIDNLLALDDFDAYATDSPGDTGNPDQGYAVDVNHSKDRDTYIQEVEILGEFTIVNDIEEAGSVTLETPKSFDDLVAGEYPGLLLNNSQVDGTGLPAPLYSPNKSSFILAGQEWYGKMIKVALGWNRGSWLKSPWISTPWFKLSWTDFIVLYLGVISSWGPAGIGASEDGAIEGVNVEVYAEDFITKALSKRIALPNEDGTPAPYIDGEFLCEGEEVVGWSPAPIIRSAYFENDNYNELDHVVALGGGTFSLITPGITGERAFRAAVTGASQSAYGGITLPFSGQVFFSGTMRFTTAPTSPSILNMTFLQVIDASGAVDFAISVDNTGALYSSLGGQSKFNILGYLDVPLTFALWFSPTTPGFARLWINGDEVLNYEASLAGFNPIEVRFGADVILAETWTIDFDDLEVRGKYYHNAYQVYGWPFTDIGPVYVDNVAQPDSKTVGVYIQTVTRYPAYGIVQITSTDPDFSPGGDVLFRVIKTPGGIHPLAVIEDLIDMAGLSDYLNATAFASAYLAVPDDICHVKFEGGKKDKIGLNDIAALGVPIADCIMEICSRYLYWFFVDAGEIKIVPYTGTPAASPVKALTVTELYEVRQIIDLESIHDFISAIYGWYKRNPSLFYVAGVQEAGGEGTGLDYTWESPVACESRDVVKTKADLLLKFFSVQERLETVRMNLAGSRIELMDPVSANVNILHDEATNYWVTRKDIGLDLGNYEVSLQLMRFLGE